MLYLVGWTWNGEEIKDLHFPLPHKHLIIQRSVEVGQTKWIAGIGFFFYQFNLQNSNLTVFITVFIYKITQRNKDFKKRPS